jgi:hypothetical protein
MLKWSPMCDIQWVSKKRSVCGAFFADACCRPLRRKIPATGGWNKHTGCNPEAATLFHAGRIAFFCPQATFVSNGEKPHAGIQTSD